MLDTMDRDLISFGMTLIGTICWAICFWWMHRISTKQNDLLEKLCEQNKRIEKLSKVEHDLIKEVHPRVNEIKESMQEMIATTKENQQDTRPHSAKRKPTDHTIA